jgi:hypothetical protein
VQILLSAASRTIFGSSHCMILFMSVPGLSLGTAQLSLGIVIGVDLLIYFKKRWCCLAGMATSRL